MTTAQVGIIVAIVVYLFGMLIIGFISSKNTNDVGDFYLGGRKLGPFVTAMSAEASRYEFLSSRWVFQVLLISQVLQTQVGQLLVLWLVRILTGY